METLNITMGSDDLRARELSGLAIRPYILDGIKLRSVEGLLQGIKFPPGDPRREEAFGAAGLRAKRMGEDAENQWVWWNDARYVYGSADNHAIIERAIRASFEQNPMAMFILRSTRGMKLTHDLGVPESPHTSFPTHVFCRVMTELRDEGDVSADRLQADRLGMIPKLRLADLQVAAKMVELTGTKAYSVVSERYGKDTAFQLLVAHLRCSLGSMETGTLHPEIYDQVEQILRGLNIPFE